MNHDAGMRQRIAFTVFAAGQQQRAHARRLADTHGGHVRANELHRVVDRKAGSNRPAGRINIEFNIFILVFRVKK